jgi:hypothetical protein
LWKEANRLAKTDLPQKEMDVMRLIAMKARAEMNYGQLLAAELMYGSLQRTVSPDSLDTFIGRLVAEEQSASTHNPMLAATYQTVLSKIIGENDQNIVFSLSHFLLISLDVGDRNGLIGSAIGFLVLGLLEIGLKRLHNEGRSYGTRFIRVIIRVSNMVGGLGDGTR